MEHSFQFSLTGLQTRPFVRVVRTTTDDRTRVAFGLLILFFLVLYSNVAVVYPALDAFRPALVVAVAALFMLAIELGHTRETFKLTWPQGFLVIVFLGVAFVSSFNAIYVRKAFETTADLAKIVLIYLLIENTVTTEKRLRRTLMVLVVGGLFPALGTMYNYANGILLEHTRAAWKGIFANPNEDAYSLLILIPIAAALAATARWPIRIALWATIAAYLGGIFVTFSRGGLVGLFAVLALIAWKQKSFIVRAGIVAVLVLGIVAGGMFWARKDNFHNIATDTTFRQRIATIEAGLLMFEGDPLLGVGPGDSLVAYPLYVPKDAHCGCQDQLIIHNSFIQVLSEFGSLGFVPFMCLFGISLFHAWKLENGPLSRLATALGIALWGFMVCSLSGGFAYTWWPYILVGLIAATKRISEEKAFPSA